MVTICASCFMSEHRTLPTVYLHVKRTVRTSTGTTCANNACEHSLSSVQQLCQTSAGNRQTVQYCVCKHYFWVYKMWGTMWQNVYDVFIILGHYFIWQFTSLLSLRWFPVMARSEVFTALHICHESGSTCLDQHTAVNVMFLLTVFSQKVLKVFPSAHRHDSHLTNTLFIARYKYYRLNELMEKE
jgi:hypothetical protein